MSGGEAIGPRSDVSFELDQRREVSKLPLSKLMNSSVSIEEKQKNQLALTEFCFTKTKNGVFLLAENRRHRGTDGYSARLHYIRDVSSSSASVTLVLARFTKPP